MGKCLSKWRYMCNSPKDCNSPKSYYSPKSCYSPKSYYSPEYSPNLSLLYSPVPIYIKRSPIYPSKCLHCNSTFYKKKDTFCSNECKLSYECNNFSLHNSNLSLHAFNDLSYVNSSKITKLSSSL